ncbi:Cytochrome b5 [Phaffia rhodozyma]|uniref:Cytochrome b5 n=1 Tax=Phaffia rhodozyma TaxID=264483 RepID=A0A0F7SQR3_PHARH|nr:Cytochrome b5 [Phaffia rhodozyma]
MSTNPDESVPAVKSEPAPAESSDSGKITQEQLEAHSDPKDIWMVISGKVYDVTSFLDEHPGGDEVVISEAGKDATEPFEDVGHSEEARKLLKDMYVGDFDGVVNKKVQKKSIPGTKPVSPSRQGALPMLEAGDLDDKVPIEIEKAEPILDHKVPLEEKGTGGTAKLRIVIVTENFLPKVDGVTRTLARLLEHLHKEGHEALLCGPESGMSHYASHPLVGTLGIPLVLYPGLRLNFLRPKLMHAIEDFKPDVIHMVDPIWLGGQTLIGLELGWAGEQWVGPNGPGVGGGVSGAVVASYHTNLATYATLFGLPWLEPIIWVWQRWLYQKCKLYLCPSPSTMSMLKGHSLPDSRLWSRGVDLTHFNPNRRSTKLRKEWGVGSTEDVSAKAIGSVWVGKENEEDCKNEKLALLYVGRMFVVFAILHLTFRAANRLIMYIIFFMISSSWEKNLLLLLSAYAYLPIPPKLVFTGDGPARIDLETFCTSRGIDAVFLGHRTGSELAEIYASADVFAFPSFTETFGQVVLEALASGLPVVGLDAEGTRDLVQPDLTGLLLRLPFGTKDWADALKTESADSFKEAAREYGGLLAAMIENREKRLEMGRLASEGTTGRTWHDAMEMCVSGYREAITLAQNEKVALSAKSPGLTTGRPRMRARMGQMVGTFKTRRNRSGLKWRTTRLGQAVGGQQAGGSGRDEYDDEEGKEGESVWRLKTLMKGIITFSLLCIFCIHLAPPIPISGPTTIAETPNMTR